jgi:hypothetical protein
MRPYRKPTAESILTRQIRDVLSHARIYHWKAWQGMGSKPGIADILGIMPDGKMLAIECKAPKGKLSDAQALFLSEIKLHGGVVVCARSVEDVIEALGLQDKFVEYKNRKCGQSNYVNPRGSGRHVACFILDPEKKKI